VHQEPIQTNLFSSFTIFTVKLECLKHNKNAITLKSTGLTVIKRENYLLAKKKIFCKIALRKKVGGVDSTAS
jgi:hypothetical protein